MNNDTMCILSLLKSHNTKVYKKYAKKETLSRPSRKWGGWLNFNSLNSAVIIRRGIRLSFVENYSVLFSIITIEMNL